MKSCSQLTVGSSGDYNANNKIVFGERMMDVVRKYGLMADEVFSEQGRTTEDGALAKVLF